MVALAAITVLLLATPSALADKKAANPNSDAFGQSFAEWMRDFWAWNWVGSPPDQALQQNNVLFMTIPSPSTWQDVNGKWIGFGEQNLTVAPGNKLVLGILAWIGETYQDHNGIVGAGIPDDVAWPKGMLTSPHAEAEIMLDGKTLMTTDTMGAFYYGPINFKETMWYPAASSYGSTGAIWVQGIGIVIPPLTPGEHTLTLYSWDEYFLDADGHKLGWFNTWQISVKPPGKK